MSIVLVGATVLAGLGALWLLHALDRHLKADLATAFRKLDYLRGRNSSFVAGLVLIVLSGLAFAVSAVVA